MPIEEHVIGKRSMQHYVTYLDKMKPKFINLVKGKRRVKVSVIYAINLERGEEERVCPFKSKTMPLLGNSRVYFDKFKHQLVEEIENYLNKGSG